MKRAVLLFDGTWKHDRDPDGHTNIVRLRDLVADDGNQAGPDGVVQRVHYDEGVGTGHLLDRALGGALGLGLSENVRDGYRWLAQQYDARGTEIYLFGFSRGAFTARSLGGFIGAAGLLKREHLNDVNVAAAWGYYRIPPDHRPQWAAQSFAPLCHPDVRIRCIGVFDTVGALGVPTGLAGNFVGALDKFHDTALGAAVDYAFQAVAIDERRGPFVPTLWTKPRHNGNKLVQQVWFPGSHSDVGGGYAAATDRRAERAPICDITLAWMASRVRAHTKLRIADPPASGRKVGHPHDSLGWFVVSRVAPLHRLIQAIEISPPLRTPHFSYKAQEPDATYPYAEFLHVSALDLIKQTRDGELSYGPPNLTSALPFVDSKKLRVIGYNGNVV